MGEWSDSFFERRAERSREKFREQQSRTLEATKRVEEGKQEFQEYTEERYASLLDGTEGLTEDEFSLHVDSVIDTLAQADAAAGEDVVVVTDHMRKELKRQLADARDKYRRLKSPVISATARIEGLAPRGAGYASPVVEGRAATIGPVVLAVLIAIVEAVPTALYIEDNEAALFSNFSGLVYDLIPWLFAALATSITMAITFFAGRALKQGLIARRAAKAQNATTGQGGEMVGGILLAVIAGVLQTVMLGMRLSTESSDTGAQGLLTILAFVSFIGAFAVFIWEFNAYTPTGPEAAAVNTLRSDEQTVTEFESAERAMRVDLPTKLKDLKLRAERYKERTLMGLSPAARKIGSMHLQVIHGKLATTRSRIQELDELDFDYEPFDRYGAAHERYGRQPRTDPDDKLDDELTRLLRD